MYYTQEQIDHANQADLVSFLQSQGEQLTRAGNEYRWKRHDSLAPLTSSWSFSERALPKPLNFSQERKAQPHRRTAPRPSPTSDCRPAAPPPNK